MRCLYCNSITISMYNFMGHECLACPGNPRFLNDSNGEFSSINFCFEEFNQNMYNVVEYNFHNQIIETWRSYDASEELFAFRGTINSPKEAKSILNRINNLKAFL